MSHALSVLLLLVAFFGPAATAMPIPIVPMLDADSHRTPTHGHVIYDTISFLSLFIVTTMFVLRFQTLIKHGGRKALNIVRVLLMVLYLDAACFIFAAGMLINGWDFVSEGLCRTAIDICLVFYVGQKVFVYLFLVERVRLLRTRKIPQRRYDWTTYVGFSIVIIGFGVIAIFAFMDPVTSLSKIDGKCRIGLPFIVTLPLLIYDITINFGFALMFTVLALRELQNRKQFMDAFKVILNELPGVHFDVWIRDQEMFAKVFIIKSCMGATSIIIPTVANLAVLFKLNGHEQGWLCFTICTIDVTWATMNLHWLTNDSLGRDIGESSEDQGFQLGPISRSGDHSNL